MLVSLFALTLSSAPAFAADGPDISVALEEPKKGKWDPKGKAMEIYLHARIQLKKEDWGKATELYVESLAKQPGCGKCLNELGDALIGAERYDDAADSGKMLAKLYPDKVNGWANAAAAMRKKRDWPASIEALDNVTLVDPDAGWAWADRTDSYIQLGDTDKALDVLDGGVEAGLKEDHVACQRVLVFTARDDVEKAKEAWSGCEESESAEVRRSAEGWLALIEGDSEKAAKALMRAGTGDATRLALAMARYDEGKLDASVNLSDKLLADLDWAPWDAHVIRARALRGLERHDEALEQLQVAILADGWVEAHGSAGANNVLLKAKGKGWAKDQGLTACELAVAMLSAKGDLEGAQELYDKAVKVYGETEGLKNSMPAAEEEGADE